MWFVYALLTMLAWGTADLFYKKGADDNERYSHLKTSIMVGLVMGVHAIGMLIFSNVDYDPLNLLIYLPVSAMYILSMTVGYFGLRYLDLSISSPIQNSSGIIVTVLCFIFLGQSIDGLPTWIGMILICGGVLALGFLEKKDEDIRIDEGNRKYRIGFVAFFMPIFYCIIDAMGTFFDAFYLDDFTKTPLRGIPKLDLGGMTLDQAKELIEQANGAETGQMIGNMTLSQAEEAISQAEEALANAANISYELTFLAVAVILFIFVRFIKKEKIAPRKQGARLGAAIFETAGQFVYVRAMSGEAIIAAPMIAAYSIVSIILSRIFLKEKLPLKQYIAVFVIMAGIIILGIVEGLAG